MSIIKIVISTTKDTFRYLLDEIDKEAYRDKFTGKQHHNIFIDKTNLSIKEFEDRKNLIEVELYVNKCWTYIGDDSLSYFKHSLKQVFKSELPLNIAVYSDECIHYLNSESTEVPGLNMQFTHEQDGFIYENGTFLYLGEQQEVELNQIRGVN